MSGLTAAAALEEGQLDELAHQQQRPQWNGQQEGGLSLTAARRRRRELELSWLEDPGRDVPFEFADLREVCVWTTCVVRSGMFFCFLCLPLLFLSPAPLAHILHYD